ncbi:hypothetical protein [Mesorhizobium sp. LSHC412B00]|uniref:hypothetical protein n=1 Tax=Mesorhizobium sp. LSHC412B00 TaxID=1287285 RepID=UPI0003CF828D|nr:hypothetical protein [Mesorhizobium sp. LSHC412B00]ESX86536.1 hypothetical protein X756_17345 [Mesorhizobium sp. LSHC412B00]
MMDRDDMKPTPPRPPWADPKSERFNMFISPAELKQIDEWAWANRIRSKSDAVRRLVQIGLVFDENANGIAGAFMSLYDDFNTKMIAAAEALSKGDEGNEARTDSFIRQMLKLSIETMEHLGSLQVQLNLVMAPAMAMKADESFGTAELGFLVAKADSWAKLIRQNLDIYEANKHRGKEDDQ